MVINTPAKINFGLWIGEKQEDGYHTLSTIFIPITLYDTISLMLCETPGIQFECSSPNVPHNETNLCWKAARLFQDEAGLHQGICITLEKNIPAGAGLGGGSSDAAAVLTGMNRLFSYPLTGTQLRTLAVQLGADVPFFLNPVMSTAGGIGEILKPVSFPWQCPILLVIPAVKISTKTAYAELDRSRTEKLISIDYEMELAKLTSLADARSIIKNDFEPVLFSLYPELTEIKNHLYEHGSLYASLSGSGSAMYGMFKDEITAKNALQSLKNTYWTAVVYPL